VSAQGRRYRRVSVNTQTEPTTHGGALSRTIPNLQRLCGDRYPAPLTYGQPLAWGRQPVNVGRWVRLSANPSAPQARIIGAAAPVRPTLAQLKRNASSLCDRAYLLESAPGARPFAANAKQVREANRTPRAGLCPHHAKLDELSLGALVHEVQQRATREGIDPRAMVEDLPFPHRLGSSPCCAAADVTPERVLEVLGAWSSGEGYDNMTERDLVELAGRAVPRTGTMRAPRSVGEIRDAMDAVRAHCWALWVERAARAMEGRVEKFKRLKGDVRAMFKPVKARAKASTTGKRSRAA